ncbi:MAG: prepilin-type N-terminal cleavage/methylation domain-containing protein [Candidatus Falkowbacteria bacterium]|nr:prepilin-type N-terminal cleavage/methylation domain-containing protein [Candidatus Falkowbacteria bacterium]
MILANNKKAFTLIELLVVIAIIGVLSTMAIIALGNARTKARDAKRVADIKQISTALELYYADNNSYPTIITPGNSLVSPSGSITYMGTIPSNPNPRNDGTCSTNDYSYSSNSNNSFFSISTCLGSGSNGINAGVVSYSPEGNFNCGQKISDADSSQYDTVQIGSQCWMKQNLNTGTMVNSNTTGSTHSDQTNDSVIEKYCYSNTASNCVSYGALYEWHEALALPVACDSTTCISQISTVHKGICPNGWHVPSDSEVKTMEMYLGMNQTEADTVGLRGTHNEGTQLKVGGTSGFEAIKAGSRDSAGSFTGVSNYAYFWQTNQSVNAPTTLSWARGFNTNWTTVYRDTLPKPSGFPLRCLKN